MNRGAALVLVLAALACESKPPPSAEPAPSARPVPKINVADQRGVKQPRGADAGGRDPGLFPGLSGETDGREVDAGAGFRAEAKKGCSDEKCVGDNCTKMCAKWTSDNPPATGDLKNKVYFGCIAACLTEADQ